MTYGEIVAARGPEVAAAVIDRLQRKIVAAQQLVDPSSKLSTILFLDESKWDQPSYADYRQGWDDYVDKVKRDHNIPN